MIRAAKPENCPTIDLVVATIATLLSGPGRSLSALSSLTIRCTFLPFTISPVTTHRGLLGCQQRRVAS